MARFYDPENEGSKSRVTETQKARKYVRLNPDAKFGMAEIDIEEGEDGTCRWYAYVEGDDETPADAVTPSPEPENVVGPDPVVKVETSEAPADPYKTACKRQREAYNAWQTSPEGNSGPEFREYLAASNALEAAEQAPALTVVADNPEPAPELVRNVTLSIKIREDLVGVVAAALRGKIDGAPISVHAEDGEVREWIETTKPCKPGREPRDWTIKPVIASSANKSAQSRLNRIDEAGQDVAKLEALLADIDPNSNQTYTVMARRFCLARLCVAKQVQAEQYRALREAGFDVGEAAD